MPMRVADEKIAGAKRGDGSGVCTVEVSEDTDLVSIVPMSRVAPGVPKTQSTQAWVDPESPPTPRSHDEPCTATPSGNYGCSSTITKRRTSNSSDAPARVSMISPFKVIHRSMTVTPSTTVVASPLALRVHGLLEVSGVQVVLLALTLAVLFCGDFVQAVADVKADKAYSVLLYICLVCFVAEYVCQCIASNAQTPRYICSLFFFLDAIAVLSVLVDIVVLEANDLTASGPLARAARAARIGTRAGRSLRLMRLMRFLRLVRITRMVKMLLARRMGSRAKVDAEDEWIDNAEETTRADTVGAQIGAATTKKVIIMTLMLLTMVSFLERNGEFQRCSGEWVHGLKTLYNAPSMGGNCTKFREEAGSWITGPSGIASWSKSANNGLTVNGLFMAVVENCELYVDTTLVGGSSTSDHTMNHLADRRRGTEIQAIPCDAEFADMDGNGQDNRSPTYFLYDLRQEMQDDAKFSMGFTAVIIVSLLGFSLIFSSDAEGIANELVIPVRQLMEDMSRTSRLNFDEVTPMDKVLSSKVFEVRSLQTAFHNLNAAVRSFSKFTPLEVVRHFLSLGAVAQLGVVERNVSIFFSDIAGWTTICEGSAPKEVLALLSEYFESMVSIIIEEHGTMLEFIGDAILAVWNAPNDVPDHAVRAINSAWRMNKTLVKLRRDWASHGRPAISIRVGLHSAKVWVGNLGSNLRMKYGVLGDGVNLASRLEELNKDYKTETMISEDVFVEPGIADKFCVRPLDVVEVKAHKSTRIYEVLGPKDEVDEDTKKVAALSEKAFQSYLNKDFTTAMRQFEALEAHKGGEDHAGRVLVNRCKKFLATPPPSKWDGRDIVVLS